MPEGLVRSGDFRNGTPVTLPLNFGTPIAEPHSFGNPVPPTDATFNSNPVTWVPSPAHFGNVIAPATTPLAAPTFSPAGGAYTGAQSVTLTVDAHATATYYTTDGSTPTVLSTLYTGAITTIGSGTEVIKAFSHGTGAYTDSTVATATYVITAVVTVISLSVTSGGDLGGTSVTITGTGFVTGATVTFGTNAATSVVVVNSTTITVVTPASSTGDDTVGVTVTNTNGGVGTLVSAFTYTPFNQTVSDNFTRANENPLSDGGNWVQPGWSSIYPLQVVSNHCEATTNGANVNAAAWTGKAFNNNQYASMTISTYNTTDAQEIFVRASTVGVFTCYRAFLNGGSLTILKTVAGASTTLYGPIAQAFSAGSMFTLAVNGSSISVYINGTLIVTVSDSSIISGSPGLLLVPISGSLTNSLVSNFAAGTFS